MAMKGVGSDGVVAMTAEGKLLWESPVPGAILGLSRPRATADWIAAAEGRLHVLDLKSGRILRSAMPRQLGFCARRVELCVNADGSHGFLVSGSDDSGEGWWLACLDEELEERWRRKFEGPFAFAVAPLLGDGDVDRDGGGESGDDRDCVLVLEQAANALSLLDCHGQPLEPEPKLEAVLPPKVNLPEISVSEGRWGPSSAAGGVAAWMCAAGVEVLSRGGRPAGP